MRWARISLGSYCVNPALRIPWMYMVHSLKAGAGSASDGVGVPSAERQLIRRRGSSGISVCLVGAEPAPRGWLERLHARRDLVVVARGIDGVSEPSVVAAVIAGPASDRPEGIRRAVAANKAVLVAVPAAATATEDWHKSLAFATEAEVPFLAAFERRFDRRIQRLKSALSTGRVGRPLSINLRHTSAFADGSLTDGLLDDLDLVRWLAGESPSELYAVIGLDAAAGIGETLTVVLKFDNGAVAVLQRCRRTFETERRQIEVLGSTATLTVVDEIASGFTRRDAAGVFELADEVDRPERPADYLMDSAVEHFVQALERDDPHLAGPEDLRAALSMVEAVERSIRLGHAVRPVV